MIGFQVHGSARIIWIGLGLFLAAPLRADFSWFFHITPAESPIRTEIILANSTPNPGYYTFNGKFTSHTLGANRRRILNPEWDFGGPVLGIGHSENIKAWLRYSGPSLIAPLTLPAATESEFYNYFRFENPGSELDWKGLVLFNIGNLGNREVQLVFRNEYGEVVHQTTLANFPDYTNLVRLLPEPAADYSYFQIYSEDPILALLLSGTKPVDGKYMLNQHQPVETEKNHIQFIWRDEDGQYRRLEVASRYVRRESGCNKSRLSYLPLILERVQELGVLDTRVQARPLCEVDRRASIFWFGRENLFSYCVNQEDVPDEARQFTDFLIQVYQEIELEE